MTQQSISIKPKKFLFGFLGNKKAEALQSEYLKLFILVTSSGLATQSKFARQSISKLIEAGVFEVDFKETEDAPEDEDFSALDDDEDFHDWDTDDDR